MSQGAKGFLDLHIHGAFVTDALADSVLQAAPLARIGPAAHPPEMGAIRLGVATGRRHP